MVGRASGGASKRCTETFPRPAALSRDPLAPRGNAEVCPLHCTGAGISQGDVGCELEGDFIAAFSSYGKIYPISIKRFALLGRAAAQFQKQVQL